MSTSGRLHIGRPFAGKSTTASVVRSTPGALPFAGQADVAGVVTTAVGRTGVLARLYHATKTDHVPHKLTKKPPASNLKASISAPLPVQRPATAPKSVRASSTQSGPSSQAKILPAAPQKKPTTADRNSSRRSVTASPPRAAPPTPQRARASRSNQVRPAIPSNVPAKTSDTACRRPASGTALVRPSALSRPDHPQTVVKALPSCSPRPSPSSSASKPSWPWAPHPNPLHSNPPLALTVSPVSVKPVSVKPVSVKPVSVKPVSVSHLTVAKIMGKDYNRRLRRMTFLPILQESPIEGLASIPPRVSAGPPVQAPVAVRKPASAVSVSPRPLPRLASPVNLPSIHRSQSQQLKARNDLVEAANDLKAENAQLSSALQDAISQRIVATTQLEQLKRDNVALQALLQPQQQQTTAPNTEALEQKLAQQAQQIAFLRRSDAASRRMADGMVVENKHMKAELDQIKSERTRLRAGLDAAEGKLERIERSLYIYPSSAVQEMAKRTSELEE